MVLTTWSRSVGALFGARQPVLEVTMIQNDLAPAAVEDLTIGFEAEESRRLLKIPAVCRILDISRASLYRLVEQRKIPYVRVGGVIRFKIRAIDDWVSRHTKVPTDQLARPGRKLGVVSTKMIGR